MTGPDPLDADPLEEALDRAVARGRPLDHWGVMRALGYRKPPEGACW